MIQTHYDGLSESRLIEYLRSLFYTENQKDNIFTKCVHGTEQGVYKILGAKQGVYTILGAKQGVYIILGAQQEFIQSLVQSKKYTQSLVQNTKSLVQRI